MPQLHKKTGAFWQVKPGQFAQFLHFRPQMPVFWAAR
jgi:hypothetical protein